MVPLSPSEPSFRGCAFQPGNRCHRIHLVGAIMAAPTLAVAVLTAASTGNRTKNVLTARVFLIVVERPCPVESGGAEIGVIAGHRIAGRVADRTVDAFDAGICGHPRRTIGSHRFNRVVPGFRRVIHGFSFDPFIEERIHVRDQILDNRQVAQRGDLKLLALRDLAYMRSACPARLAIDHHRARATHTDTTSVAIRQCRIGVLLYPRNDVENSLVALLRDNKTFETPASCASAPNPDFKMVGRSVWSFLHFTGQAGCLSPSVYAKSKLARLEDKTSNALFDTLEDWNAYLKAENIDPSVGKETPNAGAPRGPTP